MFRRILAIARKEIIHIKNDPRTIGIIFIMPIIQLVMFGYALNMEIQNVDLGILDHANSAGSRRLIEKFNGSKFFTAFSYEGESAGINDLFKNRKARAVLIIPHDFERRLNTWPDVDVQLIVDASETNSATLIRQYCYQVIESFNGEQAGAIQPPLDIQSRILFNPDMKSAFFFVPGIVALLLIMISALLTSITITREKETGTMEQILVSPVRPREIILGKVLPYVVLSFFSGAFILIVGILLFSIPFEGSFLLLILLSILYISTSLAIGLMLSTVAKTQQVAMMLALMVTLLPTIMLSGFIFPIASMPWILQKLTYIIPAKYYMFIVRGIVLKGSDFFQLLMPSAALALMILLLLAVAMRKFSTNLEK